MIPVYGKCKDRGFAIVGVARERDAETMRKAIGRDRYLWLNPIELNYRIKPWNQSGIRGGGSTFLIGRDGTILAVDSAAEEVDELLEKRLWGVNKTLQRLRKVGETGRFDLPFGLFRMVRRPVSHCETGRILRPGGGHCHEVDSQLVMIADEIASW